MKKNLNKLKKLEECSKKSINPKLRMLKEQMMAVTSKPLQEIPNLNNK